MLSDYSGPANSEGIYDALVGDTIEAVFVCQGDYGFERWMVMASGPAFVTNLKTGAYWRAPPDEVRHRLAKERAALQRAVSQLSRLGTIDLREEAASE